MEKSRSNLLFKKDRVRTNHELWQVANEIYETVKSIGLKLGVKITPSGLESIMNLIRRKGIVLFRMNHRPINDNASTCLKMALNWILCT